MRWQIENFIFCDQKLTLCEQENVQQLEPMVAELLRFFCQNQTEIVSRDELIEQVWHGRVVTDNAVNRVITKLRKVLADDPKQPKFIATFPKKGYKFIAQVSLINEHETEVLEQKTECSINSPNQQIAPRAANAWQKVFWPATILAFILLMLTVWLSSTFYQTPIEPVTLLTQSQALTRNPGRESQPQLSPDQQYLMFSEFNQNKISLRVKSLKQGTEVTLSHEQDAWVGPGSWNANGSKIAYLKTTRDTCQYYIRQFDKMTLGEPQLIHNCPAGSFGKILFTHDDDLLVFSEASARGEPFSLFSLRLSTGEKVRLNQPALALGGNSQYDLHPTKNKLLLSSPDKQQWEGFYSLDLETNQLQLLFKQDAYICCGIWDHSGERVVLLGEHPAYQLVSYDQSGGDRQVLYSGNQQVSPPTRHTNGVDYLFPSGFRNQNLYILNLASKKTKVIAESSVDERLARFSADGTAIAYVSVESGHEEIWFYRVSENNRKQLTHFSDARHYVDLHWSPDNKHVIALTLNEIHIIDVGTGQATKVKIPQVEIRGLSLKDENTLSFSLKVGANWRVHHYDINEQQLTRLDGDWQFVLYAQQIEDTLWQNIEGHYFYGPQKIKVVDSALVDRAFIENRHFNLIKQGQRWMWQNYEGGEYQLTLYAPKTGETTVLAVNASSHFDWYNDNVLLSEVMRTNADIYRTVSSEP